MQDLKYLYLEESLASAAGFLSSMAFNTFQKVELPQLTQLLIIAPLSTVIVMLSCVNIPLTTEVRLTCASEDAPIPSDYTLLSSVLTQRFYTSEDGTQSNPVIRSLIIDSTGWGTAKLTFSGSERDCNSLDSIVEWGYNIPLRIFIDLDLSMMMDDGDDLISDICCSIPLPDVGSIHVIGPLFPSSFWRKTLGHLQDLRYIKLSNGNMSNLVSALSLSAHEDMENQGEYAPSDRTRGHKLVPKLEELELYQITFPPDEDSFMSDLTITRRALFDALSTRNAPHVGRLIMTQCDISGFGVSDMVRSWNDLDQEIDALGPLGSQP